MSAKTDLIARKGHIRHNRLPHAKAQLAQRRNRSGWKLRFFLWCFVALCFSLSASVIVILINFQGVLK